MDSFKGFAFLVLTAIVLFVLTPMAYADTSNCSATSGYWRWGTGNGARMDLNAVSGSSNTYLDALRDTEDFQTGSDPGNANSRASLDQSMDTRFTTGPQPWGPAYADKRTVTLTNFYNTTGSLGSFTLTSPCVPAGATINSVLVHVTHAIADTNFGSYQARIRVGSLLTAFDLPSLVSSVGVANEVQGDINVTAVLNTAALVNGALIEFQAQRAGNPAMLAILNEISLVVDYTPNGGGGGGGSDLVKLVTGGGYVAGTFGSGNKVSGSFGFNARSTSTGANVPGSGNFEYNDGTLQFKGTVTGITTCHPDINTGGGTFTFAGVYAARVGNSKTVYSGTFSATVADNGEPGRGSDLIGLTASPSIGGWSGFAQTLLTNGNIQFHFCDLP